MLISTARLSTPHGAKYIAQLCKHFAHKVEASWSDTQGRAALPSGLVTMQASPDGVSFRIEASSAKDMIQARYVVDVHLVTFAYREDFTGLGWQIERA